MFRRRSFLIGCGSLAAAPAFAGGAAHAPAASPAALSVPAVPVSPGEAEMLALRIAGWDTAGAQGTGDSEMWVQVSSSWQVAWR